MSHTAELPAGAIAPPLRSWVLAALIVGTAASLAALLGEGAVAVAAGVPLLAAVALAILVRPERALPMFLVGLPIHLMSLVVLYGVLHFPATAIRLIQPWKEMVLVAALFGAALRLVRSGRLPHVTLTDGLVLGFVALNIVYMLFPLGDASLLTRAAAARTNVTFAGLYLLGRSALPRFLSDRRIATIIGALAVAAAVFVVIEKLLLPTDWPLRLGYSRFLLTFFGNADVQSPDQLPWTFWTDGQVFRRPSAFFANPLDLAASGLFLVGAAQTRWLEGSERRGWWRLITLVLVATVIISFARMATAALPFVMLGVALALGRRRFALVVIILTAIMGIITAIIAGPLIRQYIVSTLVFDNASSAGHLQEWGTTLRSIATHPFGIGLGTSGSVGARFGNGLGGENQYLIYGVQIGWLGILLYVALLANAIIQVVRAIKRERLSMLGGALAGLLAIVFLGMTSEVGTYLFLCYATFALTGLSVSRNLAARTVAQG